MRNLEKKRASNRRWEIANRDNGRARSRKWAKANPDKERARYLKWAKANPDKRRAKDRNRRARKRLAEGTHTAADEFAILALQNGRCEICKKPLEGRGHLDHIIPLARGGSNYPYNLQWLCKKCNLGKGSKDPRFQLILLDRRDHATQGRLEPEDSEREHQDRERSRPPAETGGCNSPR